LFIRNLSIRLWPPRTPPRSRLERSCGFVPARRPTIEQASIGPLQGRVSKSALVFICNRPGRVRGEVSLRPPRITPGSRLPCLTPPAPAGEPRDRHAIWRARDVVEARSRGRTPPTPDRRRASPQMPTLRSGRVLRPRSTPIFTSFAERRRDRPLTNGSISRIPFGDVGAEGSRRRSVAG